MIRVLLILFSFMFLTGCIQGSAMLGPAFSVATTGGIQKAVISQGVNHSIKRSSGKSIAEHAFSSLNKKIKKCETTHSATLNKIFFETLDEIDCQIIK
jgi:hypothetical protein|tara:strand:+ start:115 stop:408 length:294 start_codon:yes stop_codon:yes gene_type:complete